MASTQKTALKQASWAVNLDKGEFDMTSEKKLLSDMVSSARNDRFGDKQYSPSRNEFLYD